MLKIKKDVDFKELERFGFLEFKSHKGYSYYSNFRFNVNKNTRIITKNNSGNHFNSYDKFFDMIQEGIVEKVQYKEIECPHCDSVCIDIYEICEEDKVFKYYCSWCKTNFDTKDGVYVK